MPFEGLGGEAVIGLDKETIQNLSDEQLAALAVKIINQSLEDGLELITSKEDSFFSDNQYLPGEIANIKKIWNKLEEAYAEGTLLRTEDAKKKKN